MLGSGREQWELYSACLLPNVVVHVAVYIDDDDDYAGGD